jgi:recombination protein RecA
MSEVDQKFEATLKILNKDRVKKKIEAPLVLSGSDILDMGHEGAMSTGIESLNHVLNGGLYPGRIYEVFGPTSCGKTTLCLELIAEIQKQGHRCGFIDMEHTFDARYAMECGVDLNLLALVRPETAEEAMKAAHLMSQSGTVKLIVLDSVAQLIPKAEADKDMEKDSIGLQARFVTKALRKINPTLQTYGTVLLLINQIRVKIEGQFTSKTTSGGNMLHYACTGRLEMKRREWLGTQDDTYGQRSEIKAVKHKMGPPMRKCMIDIIFGEGIDKMSDLASVLLDTDYTGVDQAGSWIKIDGVSLIQGKARFVEWLKENEKEREQLRSRFTVVNATPPVDRPSLTFEPIETKNSK